MGLGWWVINNDLISVSLTASHPWSVVSASSPSWKSVRTCNRQHSSCTQPRLVIKTWHYLCRLSFCISSKILVLFIEHRKKKYPCTWAELERVFYTSQRPPICNINIKFDFHVYFWIKQFTSQWEMIHLTPFCESWMEIEPMVPDCMPLNHQLLQTCDNLLRGIASIRNNLSLTALN